MKTIRSFNEKLDELKTYYEYGAFFYESSSRTFSRICREHFGKIKRPDKHGVYIIRQKSTGYVLYVGKSGTINRLASFDKQDIPGRLTNVKGKITANEWFRTLFLEKGDLVIEYVFLTKSPVSPALAEAILLQAYFNAYAQLPYRNSEF